MKTTLKASLVATAVLAAAAVQAAETPDYTLTGNVSVTNDYRYRGISQSRFHPAVQGGFDFAHASGFYLGNWNSSISWISDAGPNAGSANLESDFYGGYKTEVMPGVTIDGGLLQYYYAGNQLQKVAGYKNANTTEAYIAAGYGPATLKYSYALSNLFGLVNASGADTHGSSYTDLSANFDTGYYGLTVNTHAGYQSVNHLSAASYTDWKLGVTKDFGNGFSASAAYVGTNAKIGSWYTPDGKNTGRNGAVVTLTKTM